jgi:hypothetical protein
VFFNSSQPCSCFSKISNFQIHKVFFAIFHEHKDNFFWIVSANTKVSNEWKVFTKLIHFLKISKFWPQTWNTKESVEKIEYHYCQIKKKYCLKMPYFFWIDSGLIFHSSDIAGRWNNGYSFIKDFTQCVAGQIECIKIQPQSKNSPPKLKENPESTQNPIYIDSLK